MIACMWNHFRLYLTQGYLDNLLDVLVCLFDNKWWCYLVKDYSSNHLCLLYCDLCMISYSPMVDSSSKITSKTLSLSHLKVERRNFINTNHSKRISFCVCSVNTIFITVDFEHEAKTKQRVVLFWYFSFAYTSSFYILPVEKRIHSSLDHSLIYVFLASWPQRLTWTTLLSQPKVKRN